ncbi:hypothetical protein [Spongiactinospora sp. 9N601]|uniref:hypothetical protein n=1 Tax=Spongiactinospora sp. 9N601 TaxID=3375149 RepID=UPI0037888998
MTIGGDDDHPAARFWLEVVNAVATAFAHILVKAGYTGRLEVLALVRRRPYRCHRHAAALAERRAPHIVITAT